MEQPADLLSAWQNPPSIYRSAPFWSWNDKLVPDRLCRQIQSMHDAGMGGFFMHSRYGLKNEYLSEEWFRCVSACVEKARELGMKAYLYDEDRWPSGAAGGLVTRPHPEFRSAYVTLSAEPAPAEGAQRLASFEIQTASDGKVLAYAPAAEGAPTPEGFRREAFDLLRDQPIGWHNDGTYLDTMNPAAVAEYIRVTHEAYAQRYSKDFANPGGVIPAIFTDEPNFGQVCLPGTPSGTRLPWTAALPQEFKRRRGYDLLAHLPELAYGSVGGGFSKVLRDYFLTITELYVEGFSVQIGRWCVEHNLALTGHQLAEGGLRYQSTYVGSCMPHYEHMQWPGIDLLSDQVEELITAKQCTSVADQMGHDRVLTELYGCTGWDWPLEGHKFTGDWQYAVGVNFRCPHLFHYSLAGGAKRDYPASICDHSPWWKQYKIVEDYFGRLSLMLAQGAPVRDVLVLHPIESAWGVMAPAAKKTMDMLEESLNTIMYGLLGEHYDWDFADESLLARHGKTAKDKIKVGKMAYRLVVVPPSLTICKTTLRLLERFIAGGGKVVFIGQRPDRIDGQADPACDALAAKAICCGARVEEFIPAIEAVLPRRVSISAADGKQERNVWAMLRTIKGGQLLFVQSHDRKAAREVRISLAGRKPVVLWDAVTGQRKRLKADSAAGRVEFDLHLDPTGSALISLGLACPDAAAPRKETVWREAKSLAGPFDIELAEANSLPLDYCQYRIGEAEFSQPVPTLKAEELIRKHFGLGVRDNGLCQPWYLYATGVLDTKPRGAVQLRWMAHVTVLPRQCKLAVECPGNYRITVNGKPVGAIDGWWIDEDIKTIDIASSLQAGDNEIVLSMDYRADMEIEDLYLVGDFGVARRGQASPAPGNMTLVSRPGQLKLGSWLNQGLDFYGGAVRYKLRVTKPARGRVRINLKDVACTAAEVHVNGKVLPMPWAPFVAEITDAMAEGENEVVVEVIGGRKNILGPLHTPWTRWTGPENFMPNEKHWITDYQLTPHGLMSPVTLEVAPKG
ncbi:MAG: glycosyl hydrolase [Phycisphaerae bacterium]|jgi:hypothetical protein